MIRRFYYNRASSLNALEEEEKNLVKIKIKIRKMKIDGAEFMLDRF